MAELHVVIEGFLIAFLCTFLLIPICRWLATLLGCIDTPDGKIKIHTSPIPHWGGCAIYFGFIIPFFLFVFHPFFVYLFAGLTALFLVGFVDDCIVLNPQQKFLGQFVAALLCFATLFHYKNFLFSGWYFLGYLLWVLTIINAFNLIDVMDGLAALQALCISTTFLMYALCSGLLAEAAILAIFIGTLSAFFTYNAPPASIYLGDAGALYIGGFLSFIPFLFDWGSGDLYQDFLLLPLFFVPLLELCGLIVIRTYKGIPCYRGSLDHFAIYFIKSGWSKWMVLAYVFIANIALGTIFFALVVNKLAVQYIMALYFGIVALWVLILYKAFYKKK
ncbi:MAG TPA: MraY family glycosyltransferase [Candidatus Babeliales bacterium]|nr:MraY family glycosyltransferase [Candidatus Babeliales bacterium]